MEAQLDRWVEDFPADSIREHLAELERQRGTIEAAIESLTRRLQMWIALRAHTAGKGHLAKRPSKRDAVLALLERDHTREFSLAEIRSYLSEAGVLEDSAKARHALEATVSNMTKRGEIDRPRKGFYRLVRATDKPAAPVTNLHRKEDEAA